MGQKGADAISILLSTYQYLFFKILKVFGPWKIARNIIPTAKNPRPILHSSARNIMIKLSKTRYIPRFLQFFMLNSEIGFSFVINNTYIFELKTVGAASSTVQPSAQIYTIAEQVKNNTVLFVTLKLHLNRAMNLITAKSQTFTKHNKLTIDPR